MVLVRAQAGHPDANVSEVPDAYLDTARDAHANGSRHADRNPHTHSHYCPRGHGDAHGDQVFHTGVDPHSNAHCSRSQPDADQNLHDRCCPEREPDSDADRDAGVQRRRAEHRRLPGVPG